MNTQNHFAEDAKAQATLTLEKLKKGPSRRKFKKRELVDPEIPETIFAESERLIDTLHVTGTESWAPLKAGSIKRVKRYAPPLVEISADPMVPNQPALH